MFKPEVSSIENNGLGVEISGIQNEECRGSVHDSLSLLNKKLPSSTQNLIKGTRVVIGTGLIDSGGITIAEEKKIVLDTDKNRLSLIEAERYLVKNDYLEIGEWTRALPDMKDKPWSCLTYQLVHEFGHLIDGLSSGKSYERLGPEFSPTKYGKTSSSESFAEAFAYWVFDLTITPEAQLAVTSTLEISA